MTPSIIQKMQKRFVNKVCTIFTQKTNVDLNATNYVHYFTCRIYEIDFDGIWAVTYVAGKEIFNFYNFQSIVSIHEEAELNPQNPEDAKLIQQYQQTTQKLQNFQPIEEEAQLLKEGTKAFVNINSLSELARQSKIAYDNA